VAILALTIGQVQALTIEVPNGEFNVYKPGTNYTVPATFDPDAGNSYAPFTNGPNDVTMANGTVLYDDGTSGTTFDMPGWTRVFDTDHGENATRPVNVHMEDDNNTYVRAFGAWSGGETSRIQSVEPVGIIEAGINYTLSAKVSGGGDTRVLRLIVDGQEVLPSSSVDPPDSDLGDWQVISRTYEAADIADYIGQSMTIELGTDDPLAQPFAAFDDVSLSYVPAPPEPSVSLIEDFDSLAVGSSMHDVEGWEGWFGDADAGGQVTDAVAYSGTNSLEIVGNRDDLVPNWPQQTTGKWTLTVMQYCPSDKQTAGVVYFGPLTVYDGATQSVGWISEFLANFETGKAYCTGDDTIQVDLVYDDWTELRLEVDLDAQVADFYYDNVFLATQPAPSIAGVDIWPSGEIVGIYYDDFSFVPAQ
jgi:hypothetical protein